MIIFMKPVCQFMAIFPMLDHRLRHCSNIDPTFGRYLVFAGEFAGYQEGSPQGRFATGRFATKLEGSSQLWKVRHKCHRKVRHNVRMHYKTSYYCLLNVKIYLFH